MEPAIRRIGARDRGILELAAAKLTAGASFDETMRALREAVEQSIVGGRVFYLGKTPDSPILGSIISGVGLVETAGGIVIVRARPERPVIDLAQFGGGAL